jgi:tetratricopeptide (TPR) repeat protein
LTEPSRIWLKPKRRRLAVEQARIHYLRGNLLFPRGDIEGVLREHQRSLDRARACGSAEIETAALGGLGDAEYMRGHLISAHRHFANCVDVAARYGYSRIEAANRPMMAVTRWYAEGSQLALSDALAAIDAAVRIGHGRAEMIAHHAAYLCFHALCDIPSALRHVEPALALARDFGAPRFEAEALAFRAELHRRSGCRPEALTDIHEAIAISRRTGIAYMDPIFLAILALTTSDEAERAEAVVEGENLLGSGSASHNHLHFRRDVIEICLGTGEWDRAEAHAMALEAYMRDEPTPWSDFVVARARSLAAYHRGGRDKKLKAELARLDQDAERLGLRNLQQEIAATRL